MLRNDSTPEGKKIWDAVDKSASKCPKWAKDLINKLFDKKFNPEFTQEELDDYADYANTYLKRKD